MKWLEMRNKLLCLTCAGVFFTIGKLSFDPKAANRQVAAFTFPETIPLTEGKISESKPLTNIVIQQPRKYEAIIAARHYHYTQNGVPLDIDMQYIVGTLGNVEQIVETYVGVNLPPGKLFQDLRQKQGIGFYGMFVYQNKAYLSSCINARGGSTVTTKQFVRNRRSYDISLNRLQPWLLGDESLLDRRCLSANLSTPVNNGDSKSAYQVLEKAWFPWYNWWSSHFPLINPKSNE